MARVKRSVASRRRRRGILKAVKGHRGARSRRLKAANEDLMRARHYAYVHRRTRKRDFRRLWIIRINARAREHGLTYGQLMNGLRRANVLVDRRILADLAVQQPDAFEEIVKTARAAP